MPREEDGGVTPDTLSHDRGSIVSVAVDGRGPVEMAHVLVRVAVDVFDTMVGLPLVPAGDPEEGGIRPGATVVGTVGFAGSANGLVSVGTTRAAALAITGALLGADAAAVADDMPDAFGEVTNMVAGAFRTRMAANGNGWSITMPMVTAAENMTVKYSSSATRVVCPFTLGEHALFVELVLQAQ